MYVVLLCRRVCGWPGAGRWGGGVPGVSLPGGCHLVLDLHLPFLIFEGLSFIIVTNLGQDIPLIWAFFLICKISVYVHWEGSVIEPRNLAVEFWALSTLVGVNIS